MDEQKTTLCEFAHVVIFTHLDGNLAEWLHITGAIVVHVDEDLVGWVGVSGALLSQGVRPRAREGHQVFVKSDEMTGTPGRACLEVIETSHVIGIWNITQVHIYDI